jgi:hypothetical protein
LYGFSLAAKWLPFSFGEQMYKCKVVNSLTSAIVDEFEVDYLYEARLEFSRWHADADPTQYDCHVYDEFGDAVDFTSDIDSSVYEPSEYDEWRSYDPDC